MRLIKMFGLAALAAVAAMAFVGATSASANFPTVLCDEHVDLECPEGKETKLIHMTLASGKVGTLLSSLVNVLCLGVLLHATPLALGGPDGLGGFKKQEVHTLESKYTGCGTGSAHSNCTVTVEEEPLGLLLKLGLDSGTMTASSGRTRLVCSNLGIDCKYDLNGLLFSVGAQHLTANETKVTELGGKFFCPDEGKLDGLLKTLLDDPLTEPNENSHTYVLQ